jgi:hypothetical protein
MTKMCGGMEVWHHIMLGTRWMLAISFSISHGKKVHYIHWLGGGEYNFLIDNLFLC